MATVIDFPRFLTRTKGRVYFSRTELMQILSVYSRNVSRGVWKDYALDHERDYAAFSVFRSAFDQPLCQIIKFQPRHGRTAQYSVALMGQGGTPFTRARRVTTLRQALDLINERAV